MLGLALAVPLAACSNSDNGPQVTCGAGQTLTNNVCVSPPAIACGAGQMLMNNVCVSNPGPTPVTCGDNEMLVNNVCVANPPPTPVTCGEGSTLMNNICVVNPPPEVLFPGQFETPALELQTVIGTVQHMHIDEVRYRASDKRIMQCAYTFGVMNAADPANISYLTDNKKYAFPGDSRTNAGCLHNAWDETDLNTIFVTHHGNISNSPAYLGAWDITPNATTHRIDATQYTPLREADTSYEGIDVSHGNIYVGLHEKGLGVYNWNRTNHTFTRTGTLTDVTNAWGVIAVDNTVYVGDTENGVATVDVTDPTHPVMLAEIAVGGVARGLAINGTTLFVAAGGAGLVVVDVHDLHNPVVLSSVPTPGAAIRVAYANNTAYVAAWDDVRAYDVSDPAHPKFITAIREIEQSTYGSKAGDVDFGRPPVTVRNLGVTAWDRFVMPGNWWILHSYELRPQFMAPSIRIPENQNEIDFGTVDTGMANMMPYDVFNQGTAPLTLYNMWVEHGSFAVTPTSVRIMPGDHATLGVTFTATSATQQWGVLHISTDDPMWESRTSMLIGNRSGPAVGKAMPETKVNLFDGTQLDTSATLGKVVVIAYFATF